jgi:hypothetical protein
VITNPSLQSDAGPTPAPNEADAESRIAPNEADSDRENAPNEPDLAGPGHRKEHCSKGANVPSYRSYVPVQSGSDELSRLPFSQDQSLAFVSSVP